MIQKLQQVPHFKGSGWSPWLLYIAMDCEQQILDEPQI